MILHFNTAACSVKVLFSILRNAKSEHFKIFLQKELFLIPVVFTIMPEPVNAGIDPGIVLRHQILLFPYLLTKNMNHL